ncbi:MAG TPA: type II toxin-antitoxin system VapC family toxin [Thermoanaerobaculia bacterium]|nr:type II toxin-antitoxin system VapC family toxin [Thermoanaerobaculia bacterium]
MRVVVDANLLVPLVSGDRRAERISEQLRSWLDAGVALHAPQLALYETVNGWTRLVAAGRLPAERVADAWEQIASLPITYHPLTDGPRTVEIALSLERTTAYDAAYLMLAEQLDAELWTVDGKLYRNAVSRGYRVQVID